MEDYALKLPLQPGVTAPTLTMGEPLVRLVGQLKIHFINYTKELKMSRTDRMS